MAIEMQDPKKERESRILENLMAMEEQAGRSPAAVSFSRQEKAKESVKDIFGDVDAKLKLLKQATEPETFSTVIGDKKNQEKASEIQMRSILEGLPPLGSIENAGKAFDKLGDKLSKKRQYIQGDVDTKMALALQELKDTKDQEMGVGEIFARSIIALAPALIGYGVGGSLAGVAGAEASKETLKTADELLKESRKRKGEYAIEKLKTVRERGKEDIERIGKQEDMLLKSYMDLGILPAKSDYMARLQGLRSIQDISPEQKARIDSLKADLEASIEKAKMVGQFMQTGEGKGGKGAKPPAEKEPTQSQFQSASFARQMEQAEGNIMKILQSGYDPTDIKTRAKEFFTPEGFLPENAKQFDQAARMFANAILRPETGAVIGPEERLDVIKRYFPIAGDTPDVIAQKEASRKQALLGLKAQAGKALEMVPLIGSVPKMEVPKGGMPDFSKMTTEEIKAFLGK